MNTYPRGKKCPHCGYCDKCGRADTSPYLPYWHYPIYPNYYPNYPNNYYPNHYQPFGGTTSVGKQTWSAGGTGSRQLERTSVTC